MLSVAVRSLSRRAHEAERRLDTVERRTEALEAILLSVVGHNPSLIGAGVCLLLSFDVWCLMFVAVEPAVSFFDLSMSSVL